MTDTTTEKTPADILMEARAFDRVIDGPINEGRYAESLIAQLADALETALDAEHLTSQALAHAVKQLDGLAAVIAKAQHPLSYAATALEASADNGDRYCATQLRAIAATNTETPLREIREAAVAEERQTIAGAIWEEEQRARAVLQAHPEKIATPEYADISSRIVGLQRARDIAAQPELRKGPLPWPLPEAGA